MRYLAAVLLGALILALVRGGCEYHRAEGWRDYAHNLERTSGTAKQAQEAMRASERAEAQRKATDAQKAYAAALADARGDVERFIAAHRVQPARGSGPAPAIGQAGDPAVSPPVPTGVVVDEADVRACGALYQYAVSAHDWALTVGE